MKGGTLTGQLNTRSIFTGDKRAYTDKNPGAYVGTDGSMHVRGIEAQKPYIGFWNHNSDYRTSLTPSDVTENVNVSLPGESGTIALTKQITDHFQGGATSPITRNFNLVNNGMYLLVVGTNADDNCDMVLVHVFSSAIKWSIMSNSGTLKNISMARNGLTLGITFKYTSVYSFTKLGA